jgi:hypothetical protein
MVNGKGSTPRPNPNFATNFKKVKQEADFKYRNYIRSLNCLVDKCTLESDPHHVRSRGAGGHDKSNLVPLCRIHHTELHAIGRLTFEDKYKLGDLRMRAEQTQQVYNESTL